MTYIAEEATVVKIYEHRLQVNQNGRIDRIGDVVRDHGSIISTPNALPVICPGAQLSCLARGNADGACLYSKSRDAVEAVVHAVVVDDIRSPCLVVARKIDDRVA